MQKNLKTFSIITPVLNNKEKLKKTIEIENQPNTEGLKFFALTIFYLFSLFGALLIDNLILL